MQIVRCLGPLALVLSFACVGSTESVTSVVGTYALATVDAAPLPFRAGTTSIVRGSLSLKNGGQYSLSQTDSASSGGLTVYSSSGNWSVHENAVTFVESNSGLLQLGLAYVDSVVMERRGHRNVYRRQ